MSEKDSPREISLLLALIPLVAMISLVIVGHLFYGVDLKFILLVSALIAGVIARISGVKIKELFDAYSSTIKHAFPAILILIAIGGIVGTWMYCGTVPYLIYYGLKLLSPDFVLISTFIVTALVSTFTGTSWGSAATSGVAFMGIGASLGIPLPMVAGAALSGAVFGDKISPISDTTNLCSLASNITVYQHIRGMLPNVLIAGVLSTIVFLVLGFQFSGNAGQIDGVQSITSELEGIYNFNIFMLLPAVIVFAGGYKGYNPVVLMVSSSLCAVLIGMISNGFSPSNGADSMISGFNTDMISSGDGHSVNVSKDISKLLNRGGLEDMIKGAVLYSILAIAFGAFMEVSGALTKLMKLLLMLVRSAFGLIISAFVAGGTLNAISGNAAFSILTIGQLFRKPFEDKKVPSPILARSMENSMTLLESLLPWHVTAIYMTFTLGVSAVEYAPYSIFNISGIILFFILSYRSIRKKKDD